MIAIVGAEEDMVANARTRNEVQVNPGLERAGGQLKAANAPRAVNVAGRATAQALTGATHRAIAARHSMAMAAWAGLS